MSTIRLKKSSVPLNVPGVGDLTYGELAINFADGRLYYKNSSNVIKNFVDSDLIRTYVDAADSDKLNLDGSNAMVGDLNLNGNKIINLQSPSAGNDGANKTYVDTTLATELAALGASVFPTGDYGSVDSSADVIDAFGQALVSAFDCLDTPTGAIATRDLGVFT